MTALAEMGNAFLTAHDAARGPVPLWVRVAKLGEEAGEAVGAYLRSEGHSRRVGPRSDFYDELADVVLGAYIIAAQDGGNLDAAVQAKFETIMSRGFGGVAQSGASVILECAAAATRNRTLLVLQCSCRAQCVRPPR